MKRWRQRVDWAAAFPVLLVLTAGAAAWAVGSYQAWQGWLHVRHQLAQYDNRQPASSSAPAGIRRRNSALELTDSLAACHIRLLSWQQSGREAGRQTLVLEGDFTDLLTWINDWPASGPPGSCQILQWERGEMGSVVTVELPMDGN